MAETTIEKINVLFVSSGNRLITIPFIQTQLVSLKNLGLNIVDFRIVGKGVLGYLKNISKIRNDVNKLKIDIIHAHYGLIGLVCVFAFTRKPLILSIMGDDAYGSYNLKGRRIFRSYFVMILTQLASLFSKVIIVKSENIQKYMFQKSKIQIVPNGVDIDIFRPINKALCLKVLNFQLNSKIVLFLGDPHEHRKNIALLKNAFKYLDDVNIKLINPFPVDHSLFPFYLNICDVFVLTSFREGSPNVIKEAMACNVPIVSTDVGDVRQTIGNTLGCHICRFDPIDLAQKIRSSLNFNKKTNGRDYLINLGLDSVTVAKRILKIYQQVLK